VIWIAFFLPMPSVLAAKNAHALRLFELSTAFYRRPFQSFKRL
jgi:hypothetical protein